MPYLDVHETHTGVVVLAGDRAYKAKKPVLTDFLDFHLGNYHWPAFNIADSCIFIGVVLLCISSMLPPNTSHKGNIT